MKWIGFMVFELCVNYRCFLKSELFSWVLKWIPDNWAVRNDKNQFMLALARAAWGNWVSPTFSCFRWDLSIAGQHDSKMAVWLSLHLPAHWSQDLFGAERLQGNPPPSLFSQPGSFFIMKYRASPFPFSIEGSFFVTFLAHLGPRSWDSAVTWIKRRGGGMLKLMGKEDNLHSLRVAPHRLPVTERDSSFTAEKPGQYSFYSAFNRSFSCGYV